VTSDGSLEQALLDAAACRHELVAFARRRLRGRSDAADDIVQDAYVRLFDRARAGTVPEYPRGWLYAVVQTRCAEQCRGGTCGVELDVDEVPASGLGTEDTVIVAAEGRWMLEQVVALPSGERDAVIAHLAGVAADAAGGPGRSANAMHQALFRGRARLRKAHRALWAGLAYPVQSRWAILRREIASQIEPSAFRGSGGIARAAVIGGTALATSLGAGPGLHLAKHWAQGAHAGRPESGQASRSVTAAGSSAPPASLRPSDRPAYRLADLQAQTAPPSRTGVSATSPRDSRTSARTDSGGGPIIGDPTHGDVAAPGDSIAPVSDTTPPSPVSSSDTPSGSGDPGQANPANLTDTGPTSRDSTAGGTTTTQPTSVPDS